MERARGGAAAAARGGDDVRDRGGGPADAGESGLQHAGAPALPHAAAAGDAQGGHAPPRRGPPGQPVVQLQLGAAPGELRLQLRGAHGLPHGARRVGEADLLAVPEAAQHGGPGGAGVRAGARRADAHGVRQHQAGAAARGAEGALLPGPQGRLYI